MPSFAEYLRPLAPYLPPELISTQAFANIEAIASFFPGTLAYNPVFLECRLGEDTLRTDFSVSAASSLQNRNGLLQLPPTLLTHPIWRQIHNFATHWTDASSPLFGNVDNILLEFDVEDASPQIPLPGVFFGGFQSQLASNHRRPREYSDDVFVTQFAVELLTGSRLSPAHAETLSHCFRMLPAGAKKAFIGLMLGRNEPALRVIIEGMALSDVLEYLRRIEWKGSIDDLQASFETLPDVIDFFCLCIDVGETVGPRIGLECYCYNRTHGKTKWPLFLNYLVEQGWSKAEKCAALLQYPGRSSINVDETIWPESVRQVSQLFGAVGFTALVRTINHIKVAYQPQQPVEAKAYLLADYQ